MNLCAPPMCNDGVDDDGDGKLDYPTDPGCTSPDDNDETDTCPGAGCPQCADGIDNDGDGQIDYPNDTISVSASGTRESCVDTDAVVKITAPTTTGTTVGAHHDTHQSCGSTTTTTAPDKPDKTYELDVPALQSLTITTTPGTPSWTAATAVYGPACGDTSISCSTFSPITLTNQPASAYFIVVDGYSSGSGPFTIGVTGVIAPGALCESPATTAGIVACPANYACSGTVGAKTCKPSQCSDGLDNDNDGKIDWPFDPGCSSPNDDDETNPTTLPACSNGSDDDADGQTDFPADYGCGGAGSTSEVFCAAEHDATSLITSNTLTGTTVGKTKDTQPTCTSTTVSGTDVAYALYLPVPVANLQIDTIGSALDTVLSMRDTQCGTTLACDDEGGVSFGESLFKLTNVAPGNYAILVDGYSSAEADTFVLNVNGTVAAGTACTAAAFTGTNPYLKCATGLTCT